MTDGGKAEQQQFGAFVANAQIAPVLFEAAVRPHCDISVNCTYL